MKTIKNLFLIISLMIFGNLQAQKLELKKISAADFNRFKTLSKNRTIIPYVNKSTSTTKVFKTVQGSESDKLKEKQKPTTTGDKNCAPAEISYKISAEKLTPVSSSMNIKLGNIFDLNKFRTGQYAPQPYALFNDAAIIIGGGSTSSQEFRVVPKGTSNLEFLGKVNEITRSMLTNAETKNFMTQKMERNFKLIYATSKNQLNANLGVGYSDVVGNVANLNSKLDISSKNQNYTAFYKEECYSEELNMGGQKIIDSNNPDLVYVSKVVYGRLGFFEYTTSENLLKFNLEADGGFNYNGAKFSSNLEVNTVKQDQNGQMTALLFGNTGSSKLPQSRQEFIRWADETPSTNALVPVGFILSFVDDNSTAYFVTSGTEPIQVCAPKPVGNRKYDVKINLATIEVLGVCEAPFDDTEDLWGKQAVTYLQTIKDGKSVTKVSDDYVLWEKVDKDGVKNAYKDKDIKIIDKSYVMKGLTEEEVKNLNIWFGGRMYDYEPTGSPKYDCKNCSEPQSNPYKSKFRVKENQRTIKSIDELIMNQDYVQLDTGDKMKLVYKECSSTINVTYNIQAKCY